MKTSQIAETGQRLYEENLKTQLEKTAWGRCVAIDVMSGGHELADTPEDALRLARERSPAGVFYVIRVGHKGIYHLDTMLRHED